MTRCRPWQVVVAAMALVMTPWSSASAGTPVGETFVYSPMSGPPGTVVEFSGSCSPSFNAGYVNLNIYLIVGQPGGPFSFNPGDIPVTDGAFSDTLTFPTDSPPGEYNISMGCFNEDQTEGFTGYPFEVLDADADAVTTTTTTTASTATTIPSTTIVTSVPTTSPAPPVVVAPTFTG